jgi:hypothetical protein
MQGKLPELDKGTKRWQARNPWFGRNFKRTAFALRVHFVLEKEYGKAFVGTKEYWKVVNAAMRKRFPAMKKRRKQ